jgi:hypothetical protein
MKLKPRHSWGQSDVFSDQSHRFSEPLFKRLVASSLPPFLGRFTDPYVPGHWTKLIPISENIVIATAGIQNLLRDLS